MSKVKYVMRWYLKGQMFSGVVLAVNSEGTTVQTLLVCWPIDYFYYTVRFEICLANILLHSK